MQAALHDVGTAASVSKVTAISYPQLHFTLALTGLCRFRIVKITRESPFPVAQVNQLDYLGLFLHSFSKKILFMCYFLFIADPVPEKLKTKADEFRTSVIQLLELLDISNPSTIRLKVFEKQLLQSLCAC